MAWTAPRTWTTAEIVTAAIMNTHVRDNLLETAPAKVTAAGDIVYASAANALSRLAKGTALQVLRMNSGATAPEWATVGLATDPLWDAIGDMAYATAADTGTRLAIGSSDMELRVANAVPVWRATFGNKIARTTAYTTVVGDRFIDCDATSGAFTVTLVAGSGVPDGTPILVRKKDASANAVTVDANGAETIDGAATVSLAAQWAKTLLVSDGVNWVKVV